MKKNIKILISIFSIVIIIFIIIIINKYLKINKIVNAQIENLNVRNYYIKLVETNNKDNYSREIYRLNNKQYIISNNMKLLMDNENNKVYIINDNEKTVVIDALDNRELFNEGLNLLDFLNLSNNFSNKLNYIFNWKITTETVDNVECYHIEINDDNNYDIWLSKTDLLLKKYIINYPETNDTFSITIENIELNNVSDSIFNIEDNIIDYEIINK